MSDLSFMDKPIVHLDGNARYQETFRRALDNNIRDMTRAAENIQRYTRLLHATPPFVEGIQKDLRAADVTLTAARLAVQLTINAFERAKAAADAEQLQAAE